MNRDKARELFYESGLKYSDIGSKEIAELRNCIKQELKEFDNKGFKMSVNKKMRAEYSEDGSVSLCEIRVKGWINNESPYFKNREGITFNRDGFIGFSGWADSKNVIPFVNGFKKWVAQITK